jgi:pimeloyl-ACP methyl ester carboxylesterase
MANWLNTAIQTQFRVIDGLSIRFAESGNRNDHALLLSPWPESLLAFEPMWSRLAERTHLVAIDLPGFGRSQRRDALLSPSAMGEFVIRAADAFGLADPHVVGPDIGTAEQVGVVMAQEPSLSELILRAFLLRHSILTGRGSGLTLIGSRFDVGTRGYPARRVRGADDSRS